VEGNAVAAPRIHVTVERLGGRVQLPAHEPLVEGRLGFVEHRVPRLGPVEQLLGLLRPVALGVARRLLVDGLVRDQRVAREVRGRLEELLVE
jgi:hypothetical protein